MAGVYASLSSRFGEHLYTDIAARYEFAPAFVLRVAISSNFRAPSLSQIGYEATSTGYDSSGQLLQGRLLSVNNPIARALGARELKPETSLNLSLGVTSRIGEHFDLYFYLFQIEIDDCVALSENISGDALTDFVDANFGVTGVQGASYFVNAADSRTRGGELVANWTQTLGEGELRLTGSWSYTTTEPTRLIATPSQLLALDPAYVLFGVEERNTLTDAAPRTRAQFAAAWDSERWSLQSRLSRHGSVVRVLDFGGGFVPRQRYGAQWQLDAEAEDRIGERWSLAIDGQNLTDAYPDKSNDDIFYFGNLPYDVLSPIASNGAYYYTRLRYTF